VGVIIEELLKHKMDRKEFIYLKEELLRNLEFYKSSNPTHQAFNWLYRLGFKYDIDYFNLTNVIKNITLETLTSFKDSVFKEFKVTSFGYGNINKDKLEKMVGELVKSLNKNHKIQNSKLAQPQSFSQMSDQMYKYSHYSYIFQKENLYKHSPDSSTLNLYFLGKNTYENILRMKILSNIAGNIFFSYLRIKNQLGYSVKNKLISIQENLLFYIYVQGSKKSPTVVYKHIDKVLKILKDKISTVHFKDFENLKSLSLSFFEKKKGQFKEKHKM
jgi:secreted Zn-dependent insulinase-like peptidase